MFSSHFWHFFLLYHTLKLKLFGDCRQKHLEAYWKWEVKIKKITNIYRSLWKKKVLCWKLNNLHMFSHQASQRMENTLKIDLSTCSQSYFMWTLSSTFKVISIFHYKPPCSKIQFCSLPQLWKLSRHDWTAALNLPCVLMPLSVVKSTLSMSVYFKIFCLFVCCFILP